MNIGKLEDKLVCFLSPIKFAAFTSIILAVFIRVANPFYHFIGGPNTTPLTPVPEAILKATFIFCGLFALLGNGRTIKLRLSIVLIPYYYLALLYIVKFFQTFTQSLVLPMIVLTMFSLWLLLAGEYYESNNRKCPNFVDSYVDWLVAQFNFKSNRQDKG